METRSAKRKLIEQEKNMTNNNIKDTEIYIDSDNDNEEYSEEEEDEYSEEEEDDENGEGEEEEEEEEEDDENGEGEEDIKEEIENGEEEEDIKEEIENGEEEEEDIYSIAKSYGFSDEEAQNVENLEEDEIKALSDLKKTDEKMYDNFIKTKEIIKDREISIIDIIKVEIPNEKRANLIEQFDCLKQIYPYTEEYLLSRDKIRNMYINYLSEYSQECDKYNKLGKSVVNDNFQFKKKIKDVECSSNNKRILEEKLEEFEEVDKGDEKSKLKRWLTTALSLPFDTVTTNLEENVGLKIKDTYKFLNKKLYGMNGVKERLMLFLNKKLRESNSRGCNIALVGKPGVGKCLHPETPIIMYNLTTKIAKDVKIGDLLLGDDGTPREVLSVTSGVEEMFRIYQEFGQEYVVNKSHILTLRKNKENTIVDIPLTDMINNVCEYSPVSCSYRGINYYSNARQIGRFMGSNVNVQENIFNKNETSLPKNYRDWDLDSKINFFKGLIDTSDIVNHNNYNSINIYIHKNKPIYNILDLLRSVGIRCIYENNFLKIFYSYLCEKIEISSIGEGEYYGFTLNGNERFVLGDWTITHNTAIAKALSESLNIPFAQMSFGGVNNSEFLIGHDYTYIGSRPGELSRCMIRMGSKNGIIFLDEFDKASDKKDVMSALLHITDFSQNGEFRDNYFPELTQDLSKIWFIYSMNELPTDPAMLDRLEVIKVDEYTIQDRIAISKNYLFPKYISELNILKDKIILSDCGIKKVVDYSSGGLDKKGVRDLERYINIIIEKVYFYLSNLDNDIECEYSWFKKMKDCYNNESGKIIINESVVEKILEDMRKSGDDTFMSMYM